MVTPPEIDGAQCIGKAMEVFLYNSTVCRLCGEENDNGTFLYSDEENNSNICELVNTYLPIKVYDDGELPRTICPGCTIQLEATVEFINLIINGQKYIRTLHQREIEYKKTFLNAANQQETAQTNFVCEVDTDNGVYQPDHAVSLLVAGLDKPKRKRGRPPKKHKTPEELAEEAAAKEKELQLAKQAQSEEELSGKRKRKAPTRFQEVVQGKELEKIFKDQGVTDGEDSEPETHTVPDPLLVDPVPKIPEVIGHTESGELVIVVKGKGRGRPKGRINQKLHKCAICDKEFSCSGRYMSHVAQHGPVMYRCEHCSETFPTRLDFTRHQDESGHRGQIVIPCDKSDDIIVPDKDPIEGESKSLVKKDIIFTDSLPDLNAEPINESTDENVDVKTLAINKTVDNKEGINESSSEAKPDVEMVTEINGKIKLKCPHCEKLFSSKQSRSMHVKAIHRGERPYACFSCDATFSYPRALALHAVLHRGRKNKGYACDLCGKVLNHPSSVTYHKEAEHAGQKFVCNKCGKCFKHKQLLQRHQLVHTYHRPFQCKTCNACFKTKSNLFNHQLLHSGVKKYSCEMCKQRFAHKTSLTLHIRWHNGQKPFTCKVCGKAFGQKGNLSEHARIHTGEKPFRCIHCDRRFTTSSQHRLHLRRHRKEKAALAAAVENAVIISSAVYCPPVTPTLAEGQSPPSPPVPHGGASTGYRCGWCGRACGQRSALEKHARRHTGARPFKCSYCPKSFADSSNLNKHKNTVHKKSLLAARQAEAEQPEGASQPETPQPEVPETPLTIVQDSPGESSAFTILEDSRDDLDERVIYVTYDVDNEDTPDYRLIDAEQAAELIKEVEEATARGLYSNEASSDKGSVETAVQEHMSVTDEQGNPLHFTMQDGTQLAITSLDGQSLQVITQDGQTIPVEINGFAPQEVQLTEPSTPVHELVEKSDEDSDIAHYYTIV